MDYEICEGCMGLTPERRRRCPDCKQLFCKHHINDHLCKAKIIIKCDKDDCYKCDDMLTSTCKYSSYEPQKDRMSCRQGDIEKEIILLEKRIERKTIRTIDGRFVNLKPEKNDKYLIRFAKNKFDHYDKAKEYFESRVKDGIPEYAIINKKRGILRGINDKKGFY